MNPHALSFIQEQANNFWRTPKVSMTIEAGLSEAELLAHAGYGRALEDYVALMNAQAPLKEQNRALCLFKGCSARKGRKAIYAWKNGVLCGAISWRQLKKPLTPASDVWVASTPNSPKGTGIALELAMCVELAKQNRGVVSTWLGDDDGASRNWHMRMGRTISGNFQSTSSWNNEGVREIAALEIVKEKESLEQAI